LCPKKGACNANSCHTLAEDELTKSSGIKSSPTKGRNRNGSTTEMAVDQLQASEKLIAGKFTFWTH